MHIFASSQSTNGTPRLRLEILLELRPDVLAAATEAGESLAEIGARLSNAVTIDTQDLLIVTTSQTCYREAPPPPDPTAFLDKLAKRILPNDEEWKEGDAG